MALPPEKRPLSTRREFLSGEAARKAVEHFADGVHDTAAKPAMPIPETNYLFEFARDAMAVEFQLLLPNQPGAAAEAAIAALDLLEPLEAQLTVYRETSDICQLNRTAYEQPQCVTADLYHLLTRAHTIAKETAGAYDFTSGKLTKVWGFYRRQGRMPSREEIATALATVGYDKLQFNDIPQTIQFLTAGLELNLGGIGKGYALDCLANHLTHAGLNHFLLHGGSSSVLARGSRAGRQEGNEGWRVGLSHPLRPEMRLLEFQLHDRALGTSGAGNQFFHYQGQRYGHILDPRTGWPASGVLSSTVLAPTAAEADALSTAFYVGGLNLAREYIAQHDQISALLVLPASPAGAVPVGQWQLEKLNFQEHELVLPDARS